jgi:ribosomal protein S18 acetylase RimI-like enzyme
METIKYNIRKARIKDIDVICPLYIEFLEHHGQVDPMLKIVKNSKAEAIKYLRKTIYGRETTFLLAEKNGLIVGFVGAGVSKIPSIYRHRDFGVIFDLFVSKDFRRQGIGREMVNAAFAWFKKKKIKRIEVGISAENAVAVKAWDKLGFQNVFYRKRKMI